MAGGIFIPKMKGGENLKVKSLIEFTDLEAEKLRTVNEEFTVTEDRGKELLELGYVKEILKVRTQEAKVEKG